MRVLPFVKVRFYEIQYMVRGMEICFAMEKAENQEQEVRGI